MSRRSDCGPACKRLNERQHAFHLQVLRMSLPDGPSSLSECYRAAGYSGRMSADALRSSASQLHSKPLMRESIAHHKEIERVRYSKTKERSVERQSALAEGSRLSWFLNADGSVNVERVTSDDERTRAIKSLEYDVKFDEDGEPTTYIKKLWLHGSAPYEANLAKLGGFNEPDEHRHVVEDADDARRRLAEALARRSEAKE